MPKTESQIPSRRALDPSDRKRLAELAAGSGAAVAAARVGIHPQTFASLAAGFTAHRSTVALVERRLTELASEGRK